MLVLRDTAKLSFTKYRPINTDKCSNMQYSFSQLHAGHSDPKKL